MTKRSYHRPADRTLSLRVMQLEVGKRLTSVFEVPEEFPPQLGLLLLRLERSDETPERAR